LAVSKQFQRGKGAECTEHLKRCGISIVEETVNLGACFQKTFQSILSEATHCRIGENCGWMGFGSWVIKCQLCTKTWLPGLFQKFLHFPWNKMHSKTLWELPGTLNMCLWLLSIPAWFLIVYIKCTLFLRVFKARVVMYLQHRGCQFQTGSTQGLKKMPEWRIVMHTDIMLNIPCYFASIQYRGELAWELMTLWYGL